MAQLVLVPAAYQPVLIYRFQSVFDTNHPPTEVLSIIFMNDWACGCHASSTGRVLLLHRNRLSDRRYPTHCVTSTGALFSPHGQHIQTNSESESVSDSVL